MKSPYKYRRINYTRSPDSGAGNVISRESARSRVGVDQRVSAIRAGEVPVFAYLRVHSSCNHVADVGGP